MDRGQNLQFSEFYLTELIAKLRTVLLGLIDQIYAGMVNILPSQSQIFVVVIIIIIISCHRFPFPFYFS